MGHALFSTASSASSSSSSEDETLHSILGMDLQAPHELVRQAYLRQAKAMHPDVAGNSSESTARFRDLQAAWERYARGQLSRHLRENGGDFTKFGVGSSWTDSEEEWWQRKRVMDAAGHGVLDPVLFTRDGVLDQDEAVCSEKDGEKHDGKAREE